MDERYKVAISRLGNRVRVAGSAEIGGDPDEQAAGRHPDALQGAARLVPRRGADCQHRRGRAGMERRAADAARRPAGARRHRHSRRVDQPGPRLQRLGPGLRQRARGGRPDGGPRRRRWTSKGSGVERLAGLTLSAQCQNRSMQRITPDRPWPLFDVAATRAHRAGAAAAPAAAHADAARRPGGRAARAWRWRRTHARSGSPAAPATTAATASKRRMHLQRWGKEPVVTWLGDAGALPAGRARVAAAGARGRRARSPPSRRRTGTSAIDALLGHRRHARRSQGAAGTTGRAPERGQRARCWRSTCRPAWTPTPARRRLRAGRRTR